jgi:hypothetical protein
MGFSLAAYRKSKGQKRKGDWSPRAI